MSFEMKNGVEIEPDRKIWRKNGLFHRDDGPAYEASNGYKEWWIEGNQLSQEEFNKYILEINLVKTNADKKVKI